VGSLSGDNVREIVIEINAKQLIALILLMCIGGYIVASYLFSLANYIAPSKELPLHITGAFTADHTGNPKTEFKRGELVLVNVTLEMAWAYYWNTPPQYYYYYFTTATRFLLLVQVMYNNTPIFLGFVVEDVNPGESESTGIGFRLPDDAPLGTYTVKIMVWSNWLDKGGTVLADNSGLVIYFNVTNSGG